MIYKFKSKATGDTLMLGPQGDQVLRLIGREPAARGILEHASLLPAIEALRRAADDDDARRDRGADDRAEPDDAPAGRDTVSLRRRVWPMIEMMQRAHAAGEPIVWGV